MINYLQHSNFLCILNFQDQKQHISFLPESSFGPGNLQHFPLATYKTKQHLLEVSLPQKWKLLWHTPVLDPSRKRKEKCQQVYESWLNLIILLKAIIHDQNQESVNVFSMNPIRNVFGHVSQTNSRWLYIKLR